MIYKSIPEELTDLHVRRHLSVRRLVITRNPCFPKEGAWLISLSRPWGCLIGAVFSVDFFQLFVTLIEPMIDATDALLSIDQSSKSNPQLAVIGIEVNGAMLIYAGHNQDFCSLPP